MRKRFELSVSVFVVVERGREVLLLRRGATGWKDGWYSLPAGGLDGGEPLATAAARELREETGLDAAPGDLRLVHLLHCRSGDTGGEWLGAFYQAQRWAGEPRIVESDKHDAIGWFDRDALPDRTIDYTRQALAAIGSGQHSSAFGWPP
jgi:8-oxo-dGTP diphosphatase